MNTQRRLELAEVEQSVCDIASKQLAIPRNQISPNDRLIEDLHCDSLDMVELIMELEDAYCVTIPHGSDNPVFKAVFTRQPFRLSDFAELIYLQQGTGKPERKIWKSPREEIQSGSEIPFTQLNGRWNSEITSDGGLIELLFLENGHSQYRRRSDGMRCILIPSAEVEIGSDLPDALDDEKPKHIVEIDSYLIDAEPVSTTAYCRFLNSIGNVTPEILKDWFVLNATDDRIDHMLIAQETGEWKPVPGSEKWPMILVSWYGANAYSLWANGRDWTHYRDESNENTNSFLPSEAQWEYAARGKQSQSFPWGEEPATQQRMRFGQHRKSATYQPHVLPMADVNEQLGMSPFGLHHVAGNVWQWCRDWYDETFYSKPEASYPNSINQVPTEVRSERGGSWVGPAELCRSSFRRGRNPLARGRCLGFRCISSISDTI